MPLDSEQGREAVALLSELLLDAAATGCGLSSAGTFPRASDGTHDGSARSLGMRQSGRKAA